MSEVNALFRAVVVNFAALLPLKNYNPKRLLGHAGSCSLQQVESNRSETSGLGHEIRPAVGIALAWTMLGLRLGPCDADRVTDFCDGPL